jgi:ribosomal protein L33
MEKRRCQYRNCGCIIPENTRSDAKYCSIKCRGNERTYIKRENRRFKKEKLEIVKNIIEVEKNIELLDLFNKIYK